MESKDVQQLLDFLELTQTGLFCFQLKAINQQSPFSSSSEIKGWTKVRPHSFMYHMIGVF